MTDRLLTGQEAADFLRIPRKTLADWEYRRIAPPSFKLGKYRRYRLSELEQWLQSKRDGPSVVRLRRSS